jgi:DNA invertase Pin-like site-specific DNA recombinase
MKIAIYSRKSIFTGKGESIENQVQMCKEYIISNISKDAEIFVYEDEGFSGGNTNRPKFQELMKDIKSRKIDRIVCYRLDRIGRSVSHLSNMFDMLTDYNCAFTSITEQQFDTTTPMGRAMINIASTFAQLERETIAERVRDNMLQLAKAGRWLGGQAPLGFIPEKMTYIDDEFKERTLMKLTPEIKELEIVKIIFNTYLKYQSITQVAKKLNLSSIKGKNGGIFNSSQISRILRNPLYVMSTEDTHSYLAGIGINVFGTANGNGYLTYNKTKKMIIDRDISEWIAAVSKHEGVIPSDDWLKSQELLDKNKNKKIVRTGTGTSNNSILSGLLKCAKCGANMVIKHGHKSASTKVRYDYYVCSNKENKFADKCDNPNIRVDILDPMVISKIKAYDTNLLINSLNSAISKCDTNYEDDQLNKIHSQIEEKQKASKNLIKSLSLSPTEEVSNMMINEILNINNEIKELEKSVDNIKFNRNNTNLKIKNLESVLEILDKFNKNIDNIEDISQKRFLIQTVVEKILWNGETYEALVKILGMSKDEGNE